MCVEARRRAPRLAAPSLLATGWAVALAAALAVRAWNALAGPMMRGYDAWGHIAYVLFLDLYHAIPWADQGWSYFHPPLHYLMGWALARLGSSEALLRGLACVGSLASLGIAALAAVVTRAASPERPALALLAFVAVAFLPVHLYASPMSGNELTASFFGAAALALFVRNESRARPSLAADAATGLAVGLALLSKFSGALPFATIGAVLGVRWLRSPSRRSELKPTALRGALIAGVAVLVASPYYARNAREYGTLFQMSRGNPLVSHIEGQQPPGFRTWRDFLALSPRLLVEPDIRAPHLVHSIWGSAYVTTWADARDDWDLTLTEEEQGERIQRVRSRLVTLGLLPTALALFGAGLALRDAWHGRRASVYGPLLLGSLFTLASFGAFALRVPHYSALKASYLLGLSLPYGAFLARTIESLDRAGRRGAATLAVVWTAVAAAGAALANASGLLLPSIGDGNALGAVQFYFREYEAARAFYEERRALVPTFPTWTENLAAVELADGRIERARELYEEVVGMHLPFAETQRKTARWNRVAKAMRANRLGVATALSGDLEGALPLLDEAVAHGSNIVGRVNRGAVRASLGALAGAQADLRDALEDDPHLVPAWHNLAEVLERAGFPTRARAARHQARHEASQAPRIYPYGIADGMARIGRRWMLWLEDGELRLARPPFRETRAELPGSP